MIWVNAQEIIASHNCILHRNGIQIFDNDNTLENLTVDVATGEKSISQLAQHLRQLVENTGSLS
ncbi:hypothetical protein CKY10_08415 [Photorhabdus sp. HUG-39]|uniref:Uncharacterized protein n=2 Tax=Photorhabdus TaxID=29487 RepID=A0ABX0AZX2_9GAMM|nr:MULTISPECIES: hypothetical protein [Photorhabdus]MCC8373175.1 hypothetical protein [Photorhabdus bodei]MCC8467031.1 hypothetical protein [Photorhabdus bodei]MCT8351899.1 hypothetical protein [Photorhabdus kayaii]MDB6367064.1 hypothetical protein [Photorhabdus bodei]MDB6373251.1 hypothetical protein [Photorhabdus bodei]